MLLASSGIHANGLSLARKLVERLPQGYLTEVAPGLSYGEALLAPTTAVFAGDRSAVGRPASRGTTPPTSPATAGASCCATPSRCTYRIHTVPPVPPVLRFIQQQAQQDDAEAYGTLNMGAGFALFVRRRRRRAHGRPWRVAAACDGLGGRRRSRPAPSGC